MASIRMRGGKYQVQVRKDGKSISKIFTSKTIAIKWGKEQEVLIEQGSYVSKQKSVTLSFLLSRWEQEVLKNLKSWKVEKFKVAMIDRELGHHTLDNITSSLLVKYRDDRLKIAANQTVKHELGVIRQKALNGDTSPVCHFYTPPPSKVKQEQGDLKKVNLCCCFQVQMNT